jgi:two-component sensor histidine kinase
MCLSVAPVDVGDALKADAKIADGFLEDSEAVLDGLYMGKVGIWRWRVDSDELQWTRNLEQVHDLPAGSFTGTLSSFQRDIHPDDAAAVWKAIMASVETGDSYRAVYRTAPRQAAEPLWIETSGGMVVGADGARYLTGACLDVTARVRNELELERRLRQQKAIERLGSIALVEQDFQNTMQRAVETAADVLDAPLAKILQFSDNADSLVLKAGIGWDAGLMGKATVGIEKESQAGYTLLSGGPVIVADLLRETRFNKPALLHDYQVRSGVSVVIPGSETRPFGVFGVHTTELRKFDQADVEFLLSLANIVANSARHHSAEAQRTLLVREMAHRAGNLLQLVVSIANQTFGKGREIEGAKRSFNERLGSLSRANNLVAQGGWTSTRFISLLRETLEPFLERLVLDGRDVLLSPELCFDLALILHELATNSVKYGTLGKPAGQVVLSWDVSASADASLFRFVWDDPSDSPAQKAHGGGFGSKLLTVLIERKWRGVTRTEADQGYRFSFEIPIAL